MHETINRRCAHAMERFFEGLTTSRHRKYLRRCQSVN